MNPACAQAPRAKLGQFPPPFSVRQRLTSGLVLALVLGWSGQALGRDASDETFYTPSDPTPMPRSTLRATPNSERAASLRAQKFREQWLLSVEAVTHAPVDLGIQVTGRAPFGLRLSGGFGWVPSAYAGVLQGVAASANSDARAEALLREANYGGHTWRVQLGIQPFRQVGLYLDGGYARANLSGAVNLSDSQNASLAALGGSYVANTALDFWLVELGYQAELDRLVVGAAFGLMGTIDSRTKLEQEDADAPQASFTELQNQMDRSFETYGYVPTLTLRLGVDLL